MSDNDYEDKDYLAIWIAGMGITLTGECAFCGTYTDLEVTSADDLVCQTCKREFEDILDKGESE